MLDDLCVVEEDCLEGSDLRGSDLLHIEVGANEIKVALAQEEAAWRECELAERVGRWSASRATLRPRERNVRETEVCVVAGCIGELVSH